MTIAIDIFGGTRTEASLHEAEIAMMRDTATREMRLAMRVWPDTFSLSPHMARMAGKDGSARSRENGRSRSVNARYRRAHARKLERAVALLDALSDDLPMTTKESGLSYHGLPHSIAMMEADGVISMTLRQGDTRSRQYTRTGDWEAARARYASEAKRIRKLHGCDDSVKKPMPKQKKRVVTVRKPSKLSVNNPDRRRYRCCILAIAFVDQLDDKSFKYVPNGPVAPGLAQRTAYVDGAVERKMIAKQVHYKLTPGAAGAVEKWKREVDMILKKHPDLEAYAWE